MQHYGLDRLASENNAVAVYLYVPKAVVKRKGFNLEWCDSSADAGPFFGGPLQGFCLGGAWKCDKAKGESNHWKLEIYL